MFNVCTRLSLCMELSTACNLQSGNCIDYFVYLLYTAPQRMVTIAVVALIVGGLFLFTYKSTSFDWEGFILVRHTFSVDLRDMFQSSLTSYLSSQVISASFLTGVRWTSAQILLQKEELGLSNPLDTIYHLQPIMILTLVPLATLVDGRFVNW